MATDPSPLVRGLTKPCPRCGTPTVCDHVLVKRDWDIIFYFECGECGKKWKLINEWTLKVEELPKGGRPPRP
ncbi:hypothetical protein CEE36_11375 [candidate division TA06 bacterium B3_TA06]|uniref:Uncharacterized protein n=1 Tax=candidate division TA06 bacterium B3_TA06 TaxID=2012487 RepID=A0A532UPM2_UNCT6|nr:MAG: hypothetical protein CEE36_11375 [candidate division TA06 bacterium B3_TA06]